MKKVAFIHALCAAAVATACGGGRQELTLSGAFALYPLAVQWAGEYQALHPDVRIDVSAGGAGKGMTDVLAGVVDFGMVSREVYESERERGAVGFAVARDAVAATVNADNPLLDEIMQRGLSRETAVKIWVTGEITTWGGVLGTDDRTPLHAYTRSDACGAAETWAAWLGVKQEDLCGTAVFGDPGVAAAVQKDVCGIGMNNIGYIYDGDTHRPNEGLAVLPIDADGDGRAGDDERFCDTIDDFTEAISCERYPSPPARDLYLVTRGVPTNPAAADFLMYVLEQGQLKTVPAGYIPVPQQKREQSLRLLHAAAQKDAIAAEKDTAAQQKDAIAAEKDTVARQKDAIAAEKDAAAGEKDRAGGQK